MVEAPALRWTHSRPPGSARGTIQPPSMPMAPLPASFRFSLLLALAPLAHASQEIRASQHACLLEEELSYVDPYDAMSTPQGGQDGAPQLPPGEVFYEAPGAPGIAPPPIQWVAIDEDVFNEAVHFVQHGTETWMRGPDYKACVSASGFTYIPFLGTNAPRNYPVTFELVAASLGGQPLELEPEGQVTQLNQRFVLDRGPIDVIYEIDSHKVEQLFALNIPGASGDLILDVRVTSDMVGAAHAQGFRFSGPDGGVDYGAATVFDGAGYGEAIETILEGNVLRLTVPAAFIARAKGHVLIDPIITTYVVDGTGGDQREVDVAYDETMDTFTFVYEDTFSGNDADIYRRTRLRDGTLVNGGLVFGNSQVWRDPAIANLNSDDVHLIVASGTNGAGNEEIHGRTYRQLNNILGSDLLIGDTGGMGWDNIRPDVGGNARSQPGGIFLVVWERSFESTRRNVRLRSVAADGTLGTLYSLDDRTNTYQEEVSISQSAGAPQSVNVWNLVWRNEDLLTDTDSLRGAQLTTDVFIASNAREIDALTPGRRMREIDVSDAVDDGGVEPVYLATYDDYSSGAEEAAILVIRDNELQQNHRLADLEHADPLSRLDVRLGATHDRFLATYVHQVTNDVYATVLVPSGDSQLGVAERRSFLGSTLGANQGGAAISTRASSGGSGSEAGIGWTWLESTSDYGAVGVTFNVRAADIPGYHFCVSRPNSTGDYGFLTMSGTPSLATTKVVTGSGLPPNQFAILLTGNVAVNIPMIGGSEGTLCLGGQFGRYNNQVASSGAGGTVTFIMDPGAIPAPFGTYAAMAGEQFFWQAWHRDVAAGLATSNLTNAFSVTFE